MKKSTKSVLQNILKVGIFQRLVKTNLSLNFIIEINNHKNRGESLQGKIFDKVLNKFVKKCNDPYLNRHIKFDQRFFLKKGSVFSRMDAEIELLLHE